MAAKAVISNGYRWRLALIGVVCLLFAAWSAYDGFVKYPRINKNFKAWVEFKDKHGEQWVEKWPQHAADYNLPEQPERSKSQWSMIAQYVQLAITLPIGLWFSYLFLSSLNRWVASDENGLTGSRGEQVPYDSIATLDKKRWEAKGIAIVNYSDDQGQRRFVLDDWKFEREPTDQILIEVEQRLRPDQIVGDKPESEKTDDSDEGQSAGSDDGDSESAASDKEPSDAAS